MIMVNLFAVIFFLSLLALPLGLFNPKFFQPLMAKVLGRDASRKNVFASFFVLAFVSFVGVGITAPKQVQTNVSADQELAIDGAESATAPILEKSVQDRLPTGKEQETGIEIEQSEKQNEAGSSIQDVVEPEFQEEVQKQIEPVKQEPIYSVPVQVEPVQTAQYNCSANLYNCSDFSTHAEAQTAHDFCMAQVGYDVHALDGNDNDGLACESLP
jgi:hypothetical protein